MLEKGYTERQLYEDFTYETLTRMGMLMEIIADVRLTHEKRAEMKARAQSLQPGQGFPTLRSALRGQH